MRVCEGQLVIGKVNTRRSVSVVNGCIHDHDRAGDHYLREREIWREYEIEWVVNEWNRGNI